ncbi:hypothetical protein PENTCL1PPCAC_4438, partial [Pristionchus entomophagus]
MERGRVENLLNVEPEVGLPPSPFGRHTPRRATRRSHRQQPRQEPKEDGVADRSAPVPPPRVSPLGRRSR